ncbi:acyltransferase family protein [Psychrobacter jeotgali]|uniref:acyltransferase family protein n=1 Tax=Psychrobacter jeotgali TaxID=179010 RepID=UPI001919AF03|nr:acyltransferase family protein [Psychrobacter jeotgali]
MNYRADIQVIRGIAVILVVLFHLGFSSIKSGFLGVDVFFVISGFLMAVLYDKNNISNFYLRRAKRLLPAYYATILFTLLFSYLLTTPNEAVQVANQAKYAIAFASNLGFWAQNSYFSTTDFNPLLHLWSLGVEMQFYLIVPILYWLFSKNKYIFLVILIISLVTCFFVVGISPKTSFFMLPFRLWEFLLGYGAAYYFTNQGNLKFTRYKGLGLVGLVILFIIPLFTVNGEALNVVDGHPGLFALIVTIATALILVFGIPSFIESSMVAKLLERIGKYSYSIYLAHFPVIVLYLSKPFSGTNLIIPSLKDGIIITILTILTSALLYYFFEHKRLKYSVRSLVIGSSLVIALLVLILPLIQNKFFTPQEHLIFQAFKDRGNYRCGKMIRILEPTAISCDLTPEIDNPKQNLMLVGNSHSDSIKDSFVEEAKKYQAKLFFMVSNEPLMEGDISAKSLIEEASTKGVNKLILHFKKSSISEETIKEVVKEARLVGISVYFIEPVPEWQDSVPVFMYDDIHKQDYEVEKQTKADYLSDNFNQISFVRAIDEDNFVSLPVVDYFCTPNCRYASEEGRPFYFDSHHLTITGSHLFKEIYNTILRDQKSLAPS